MSDPQQPQVQTIVQAGGRVADSIVGGFANTPVLLLIILLNISMIFAAAYYLTQLEESQAATSIRVTELLRMCIIYGDNAYNDAAGARYRTPPGGEGVGIGSR